MPQYATIAISGWLSKALFTLVPPFIGFFSYYNNPLMTAKSKKCGTRKFKMVGYFLMPKPELQLNNLRTQEKMN